MTYGRMISQYHRTNVETASQADLIIMCYEKFIQLMHQSRSYFEEGKFEEKARALQKALDIMQELQQSLNFEKGGEIANNLDAIYTYLNRRLLEGDIKKDLSVFDEAARVMGELKEAWLNINSQPEQHPEGLSVPISGNRDSAGFAA